MKFNFAKNCLMALTLVAMGAGIIECYYRPHEYYHRHHYHRYHHYYHDW